MKKALPLRRTSFKIPLGTSWLSPHLGGDRNPPDRLAPNFSLVWFSPQLLPQNRENLLRGGPCERYKNFLKPAMIEPNLVFITLDRYATQIRTAPSLF